MTFGLVKAIITINFCVTQKSRGKTDLIQKFFTISQAAQIGNVTTETLRHYDRIGLLKPCKTDQWTRYRYYSEQDIVRLNTICALRCMDLSLHEIKDILEINDFKKIIGLLKQAEKNADNKIAEIKSAQSKIQSARLFYESKSNNNAQKEVFITTMPKRVILLSENLREPSLENLWNYHRHFYEQVGDCRKDEFLFEDLAGIYETHGESHLFAECTRYSQVRGLKTLPEGKYLCANCTEENRKTLLFKLMETAKSRFGVVPEFSLQIVVLSGILQWNYQIQIYIE